MNETFLDNLYRFVPREQVYCNEPMDRHTTFKVGGNADYLVQVGNKEQLTELIRYLKQTDRLFCVIGNGSNLLVSDEGYRGVIIKVAAPMNRIFVKGNIIEADAGATLEEVAEAACENELTGMEFASGIPGTIGGACVMNAGAYDGEMKQIIKSVLISDPEGNLMDLDNATMEFGYRKSILRNKSFTVVSVQIELEKGDKMKIRGRMDELWKSRKEKQPLEFPSAGSTFKRPEGHYAGKLIMDSGLRGFGIGGAQISEKHCGFIVNQNNATAQDVYDTIRAVVDIVKTKTGIELEPEVVLIGKFK